MLRATLNQRKLWSMSCETLFQNFTASLTPEMIVKLCRRHQIPLPDASRGEAALFQVIHEHCHRDSPLARQIQRFLNRKHAALIAQLASRQPDELRLTIESIITTTEKSVLPDTLPGILWAVCSDPRETVRPLEQQLIDELHWLSHCLLMAQFQGNVQIVCAEEKVPDANHEMLKQELENLKAERHTLRHDIKKLQSIKMQMAQDRDDLQQKLDLLVSRCEAVRRRHQPVQTTYTQQGMTARDVKKLQYEFDKLTETLSAKEDEIQRLMTIVSSYESMTAASTNHTPSQPQMPACPSAETSPDLNGKRVALIGGLTKASMHYEQAISQLGGTCVQHAGNTHQGHKKLVKLIRQADVVFCPVNCVSHGTAHAAKKLCRAFNKPCYFLRSAGVSHIRAKLREVAPQI